MSLSDLEYRYNRARSYANSVDRYGRAKERNDAWNAVHRLDNEIMAHPDYVHLGER